MFNIFKKTKINKINSKDVSEFIKNEKDLVIIDIRTSMEFMQGAIKNSKNIDFYHPSFLSEIKKLDIDTSKLEEKINLQIEKLKEYRQSLISEAVTGKIDVKNYN